LNGKWLSVNAQWLLETAVCRTAYEIYPGDGVGTAVLPTVHQVYSGGGVSNGRLSTTCTQNLRLEQDWITQANASKTLSLY
jgi:hypothetical protein